MADSVVRLTVNSSEYDQKLKRAAEGLTRYADECRKVGGTLEVVEKDTLEYVRALGQMDTVSRTATGKLSEMKKAFTELSVTYNKMTAEEKQSPFGKALSASLDQLKVRINESKAELDQVNQSLSGSGGLKDALNGVASQFGMNIEQLTKFGGVMALTTTAVQVAKDAFFQSESGIDEWGRTVEGAKGAYSVFLDTLNNGNWSQFFQNLQTAIQGGRDLYDVFDRLGSIKSNNAAAIAIVQQQIAQLRLAKQQGENVDAQLKEATARLAQLQKQSINAGKAAGTQSAFQTIRNGVNSIGGAGVNGATIQYAVERIMKNGQSEFDKYKYNYQTLEAKGTRTVVTPGVGWDSQGNKNPDIRNQVFDITLLTEEQQKQYALAKAITEGETRIQQGIAAYAQAVQEGTSSAREQFKGNRYALQGSGGSDGSGGGKTTTTTAPTYAEDSIAAQQALVSQLIKQWNEAGAEVRNSYIQPLIEAEAKLKEMKDEQALLKEQAQGRLKGGDVDVPVEANISGSLYTSIDAIREELAENPIKIPIETGTKEVKSIAKAASIAAEVVGSIGDAFNAIEDPAAKVSAIVAESIATVALAYAQTLAQDQVTKSNIFAFIAAAAAATVSMATTIASIHDVTGYAKGGIVEGNSYSGDNMMFGGDGLYGLNAGELVLTKAQQNNLAQTLEGNGLGNINVTGRLNGTDILLSADRAAQASGRGQLVTWK